MACRPGEFLCVAVEWLSNYGEGLPELAGGLLQTLLGEGGVFRTYIKEIIAAASFAFGVWRWWKYREAILYKRLVEYIKESDQRLKPTSDAAVDSILRPGRAALVRAPAYAVEMQRILARHSWARNVTTNLFGVIEIDLTSKWKLERELGKLRKRHEVAQEAERSLVSQQAHVHMIAAAISCSRALKAHSPKSCRREDFTALREFRRALQLPGQTRNIVAREGEAIQLFRLGKVQAARERLDELLEILADDPDPRHCDLRRARVMRFKAQAYQLEAYPKGSAYAWSELAPTDSEPDRVCALTVRDRHLPYRGWDAVEHAELHYVAAFVADRLGYTEKRGRHLDASAEAAKAVFDSWPLIRPFVSASRKRLWRESKHALRRVESAKNGQFDLNWLGVPKEKQISYDPQ